VAAVASEAPDWPAWQGSWDRQQRLYLPDREERFAAMLDAVEALAGRAPTVLDLACGPGSITARLLARFPGARIVGIDLDPALLAIARGVFAGDSRACFVEADLADPEWTEQIATREVDAVLTATALHWLTEPRLARLYAELAVVLRPGGIFCNADHMPDGRDGRITRAVRDLRRRRRAARPADVPDWDEWWSRAAADPTLTELVARRDAIFGAASPQATDGGRHPAAVAVFAPPAEWHVARLREVGFAEAAMVWRGYDAAMVAALR